MAVSIDGAHRVNSGGEDNTGDKIERKEGVGMPVAAVKAQLAAVPAPSPIIPEVSSNSSAPVSEVPVNPHGDQPSVVAELMRLEKAGINTNPPFGSANTGRDADTVGILPGAPAALRDDRRHTELPVPREGMPDDGLTTQQRIELDAQAALGRGDSGALRGGNGLSQILNAGGAPRGPKDFAVKPTVERSGP